MDLKNYNWLVSMLAVVATLALLAGGQVVWQKYSVAQPLEKLIHGIDGVVSASWEEGKKDDAVKINIKLHNVTNLQKTYGELSDGAKKIIGARPFKINIEDSRTPELERFYYNTHYYVQEAVSTGNYALMAERLQGKAAEAGVAVQVYVDAKSVYLQMTKESGQMYVVVSR